MKTYHSSSSDETKIFGELLAKKLRYETSDMGQGRKSALVFALQGELGAGKTTFTQGFFTSLGIKQRAISPTFVIMRRYKILANRKSQIANSFANIYHFDAYRLKKAEDMEVLEFGKILADPKNIILIEWPERIKKILPKTAVWLKFEHGRKENERKIIIKA